MRAHLRAHARAGKYFARAQPKRVRSSMAAAARDREREREGRQEDAQDVQQLQECNTFQASLIASLRKKVERWKWSEMVDAYGRRSWMHRETRQAVFVCPF